MDLLEKKHIDLSDVMITVLDEADQMADMGFLPVVKEILSLTKEGGQHLLFSATLDRDVDSLVKRFLKDPITHSLENEKSRSVDMTHHLLLLDQQHKDEISAQIAARDGRTIFFVRTKHGADKLAEKMLRSGVPVGVLHGGKSQGQRTRVLKAFKDGRASALVATDVAARGIHVDDVSLVVHVDAPADHKDYLHRAGRTARAGATGTVVTLATHKQKKAVFGITNRAAVKLIENQVRPGDSKLQEITGAQQPSGIPIEVEPEKPARNDRKPGSRSRSNDRGNRDGNFKPRREGGGRFESDNKFESAKKYETAKKYESQNKFESTRKSDAPAATETPKASRTSGNRGRVESSSTSRPTQKAPRMPLEKRQALEKRGSGKPGAPKKFANSAKSGGKPFKSGGKPSGAKRG